MSRLVMLAVAGLPALALDGLGSGLNSIATRRATDAATHATQPPQTPAPAQGAPPAAVATLTLTIDGVEAPARPGDVVVLGVTAPVALARATATAIGRVAPMWAADSSETAPPRAWQTLVGIDVETAPGAYPLTIEAETIDGRRVSAHTMLTVERRVFGVRQLRVDPKFSSPPASELPRIEREAKRLNAIFATVNPARHWLAPIALPVSDRANSTFGVRSIFNGQERGRHNGTDFASARGTPVHAPAGGDIVLADDLYFTGNTVVIDHGQGLYSLMAHLESTAVKTGDIVNRLDLLGHVGATGRATGPHLHWSVRLHGARVDPLSLASAGRPNASRPDATPR